MKKRICAVIPAAGRGTRLKANVPKVLVPLTPNETILDVLYSRLRPLVDHIHLVTSPHGLEVCRNHVHARGFTETTLSVQTEPVGMGDAIFGAFDYWGAFDQILILWGDQVFISDETLKQVIAAAEVSTKVQVIPTVFVSTPYVEFRFAPGGVIQEILQSREGEAVGASGFSDMGLFLLSNAPDLISLWKAFCAEAQAGAKTKELNFLPFLKHLSNRDDWATKQLVRHDAREARGVNDQEDLRFFRSVFGEFNRAEAQRDV